MKYVAIFVLFVLPYLGLAQKNVYLAINHKVGSEPLEYNQTFFNDLEHAYQLTRVDYYISSIKIIHDGGQTLTLPDSLHLLIKGSGNSVNYLGNFDVQTIENIVFSVGVHPSLNNADPALQPAGSPLAFQSPTMHWGWASGYFFVCLEGLCGVNATLSLPIQLHALWNDNYFEQSHEVEAIENEGGELFIHLDADYNEALRGVNIDACPIFHGANEADLTVLHNFRDYVFSAGDGNLLQNNSNQVQHHFSVFPNPVGDHLNVETHDFLSVGNTKILLYDVLGRLLNEQVVTQSRIQIDMKDFQAGVYILKIAQGAQELLNRRIVKE